ncbi:thiol-disulfide oxidoreductase DCC family protein [Salegentibacter flavus]|uniref:Predicted thiol-disulfide oxidoreductase YuxK, DCC family n=1 Tax=Salegentibacter flavus TaxID=287099 RepID=A0A1I5A7M1_9FLAO|nr:DCC1-like thiol-disulfide oxidoreductase family protein [Salegentibacter flavus]SFN58447.1 Predicted thiol-disulfide oxidoreductase YuxK, DCC family [Salegentibacter flavus]
MFVKINKTEYPPREPTMVWDGTCGFCKYWKTRWQLKTKGKIRFVTYQEKACDFPDIPLKEFKKASRLIEPDGSVYSGPDSAYRSIYYTGNEKWHHWYRKYPWFERFSDLAYNHIAKNRDFYFKITKALFGKDPANLKSYWLFYLLAVFVILALL